MEGSLQLDTHLGLSKARAMLSGVVDRVVSGGLRVINRRHDSVALVDARMLDGLLAEIFPFEPRVYFEGDSGVEIWLPGLDVFGSGEDLDIAIDTLIDAVLGYVSLWEEELRHAPNHRDRWGWVHRVQLAGHRDRIRDMLFEEREAPHLRRTSAVL